MARTKDEGAGVKAPARLMDAIVSRIRQNEGEDSSIITDAVAGATDYISTQSLALDMALNMPGIPVGRLTVVRGWESSGKSTLITHLVAETLQRGGLAMLLDSEFAFDEERAKRIGVDMDGEFLLMQPPTVEKAIALIESSIKEIRQDTPDALVLVVWDSVGGTPTQAQIENEFGESEARGQHARIISSALRRITGLVAKENIALVIVNQNKELNIDGAPFRSSENSTMLARHPLQFHASTIIDMRKGSELVLGDKTKPDAEAYGIIAKAKITKNKCSNPFGKCEIRVLFDTGFDDTYAHFQAALRIGMIQKKGTWYQMAGVDKAFHEGDFESILDSQDGLLDRIALAAREQLWSETVKSRFLSGG